MVIDTKEVTSWAKLHLTVVVPVACGLVSWFAATRWQVALDHNQVALIVFYFFIAAVSGVTAAILTILHLGKLGFFGSPDRGR